MGYTFVTSRCQNTLLGLFGYHAICLTLTLRIHFFISKIPVDKYDCVPDIFYSLNRSTKTLYVKMLPLHNILRDGDNKRNPKSHSLYFRLLREGQHPVSKFLETLEGWSK